MHKILINDDLYHLPESWDELTVPQLLHLVKLTKSDIPIEQLKIEMLLYCLQAHVRRHRIIYQDKVRIAIGQRSKQAKFTVRNHSYLPGRSVSVPSETHYGKNHERREILCQSPTLDQSLPHFPMPSPCLYRSR